MPGMSGHASGEAVVGVTIAMVAMAGIVVLSRLFTRIFIVKSPGLDDAFITASLIFSIATTVTMCLQVKWGMGKHIYTLTLHDSIESQKPFYVSIWVYNLAMGCTKYSLLLQYLRIFPQKTFRRAVFVMLGINTVYLLWTTGSAVFACWPISYFWTQVEDPTSGGRCLERFKVWFANAGMNIATYIAIGVLPLPVLKHIQLPKRQRIMLMIVFGLGGFTCIVSILRLQSLLVISRAEDITWENPLAAIWSCVEVNTGILCSCLPTLKAAVSRVFPRLFGSQQGSGRRASEASDPPRGHHRRQSTLDGIKRRSKKLSFDALGRGLTGRSEPTQSSTINSCSTSKSTMRTTWHGDSGSHNDVEMKDFGTQTGGCSGEWERRIQVVTTVEQDVEKIDSGEVERGFGRFGVRTRARERAVEDERERERERETDEGRGSESSSQRGLFG